MQRLDFKLSLLDQRQLLFPFVLPQERILPERDSCLILNLTELDHEYTAIPFAEKVCHTSFYPPGG